MKVVACENCGAKYQIDDNEKVDDYECSVCTGNLKSVEEYPSKHSLKKQNNSSLYRDDAYSKIVYCKDCGLKYTLKSNENLKDYECSSCYGDLRYIDEKFNEDIDELPNNNLDKLEENKNHEKKHIGEKKYIEDSEDVIYVEKPFYGSNTLNNKHEFENSNEYQLDSHKNYKKDNYKNNNVYKKDIDYINNPSLISNTKYNNISNFDSDIIYPMTETNLRKLKKKLRNEIKKDFSESISKIYGKTLERNISINQSLYCENKNNVSINKYKYENETIEDKTQNHLEEKKSKESEESIFDKISKRNTGEEEKENSTFKTPNQKQKLVPHPNTKNTSYHDVYIIAGLIIALIGLLDVLLSKRIYSVIFIVIGIIIFIIGLIKNNNYVSTEKRGRLIREKLLTLPDNFYVLYYVRVPDSNEGINHVVVGSSGIFSIVSQSYNEKEDKNLVNKSNLDDLTLLDESENIDVTNNINNNVSNNINNIGNINSHINNKSNNENNIITNKNRDNKDKNKNKEDYENNNNKNNNTIDNVITKNIIKENNQKTPRKFKFKEAENKFPHNNKIKQKSIHLSEELIDFLNESGFQNFYVEPLVGFVNNEIVVIINMPLTDEDLFIDELLQKIVHGKRQLDDKTTHRIAVLLSQYATECSS